MDDPILDDELDDQLNLDDELEQHRLMFPHANSLGRFEQYRVLGRPLSITDVVYYLIEGVEDDKDVLYWLSSSSPSASVSCGSTQGWYQCPPV